MKALTPLYQAHIARIVFTKLLFINMIQAGLLLGFGDEEDKKRLFSFQNKDGRFWAIRLPWKYKNRYLYIDPISFREANQIFEMLGVKTKGTFGRLLKSKMSVSLRLAIEGISGRDWRGEPIVSNDPELTGWGNYFKDWGRWVLNNTQPTAFQKSMNVENMRTVDWDYFTQFTGFPLKVGELYQAGFDPEEIEKLQRLRGGEAYEKRRVQRELAIHPENARRLFEEGKISFQQFLNHVKRERKPISSRMIEGISDIRRIRRRYPDYYDKIYKKR
jgi:hypothetical protein